ncbi:MAG TPA: ribosome-associated translation inhibitor RaiA [Chthonomonadales bacterium]|nr:ribosome-associated translation inhibitor RaiA [Chthonomonadales bacterium]
MRLTIRGKSDPIPESLQRYAERKLAKLDRLFRRIDEAEIRHAFERGIHIVELSMVGDNVDLRSEERSADLHAAVDNAIEKIERRVKRFKTKVRDDHRRPSPEKAVDLSEGVLMEAEEEPTPRIVRRKRFPIKPMPADEAALQMELSDHDFFLFLNEETGAYSVMYRRRDGNYGIIEPES